MKVAGEPEAFSFQKILQSLVEEAFKTENDTHRPLKYMALSQTRTVSQARSQTRAR